MNNTVNKDLLVDILLQENQQLKALLASYKNDYLEVEKISDQLRIAQQDQIQILQQLVDVQNKEIEKLQNRLNELEEAPVNLPEETTGE